MYQNMIDYLEPYLNFTCPIIYIHYYDYKAIDDVIEKVKPEARRCKYDYALGYYSSVGNCRDKNMSLESFLTEVVSETYIRETFIILNDIQEEMDTPRIRSLLRKMCENILYKEDYKVTIVIVSDAVTIPKVLENYVTVLEIPLPDTNCILDIIDEFVKEIGEKPEDIIYESDRNDLALGLRGMNEFQIRQILALSYMNGGIIERSDLCYVREEKKQLVLKSGLLEYISDETSLMDDVGGLDNLKSWLRKKEKVFADLDQAVKFGVIPPKGIMIVGIPGCGKSLTAKATANLFHFPLFRLDFGKLFGKYVGESEENMRKALKLAETVSPCVLWIDEIEKALAGNGGQGGGADVTTRLVGQFLTWMQEKRCTTFVVATANAVEKLPVEFLRKGRFDEVFYVDLPNNSERKDILEVHLKKWSRKRRETNLIGLEDKMSGYEALDIEKIVNDTDGFSGAELEAVVNCAVENAFLKKEKGSGRLELSQWDIEDALREIKPMVAIQKEKYEDIREQYNNEGFKKANW